MTSWQYAKQSVDSVVVIVLLEELQQLLLAFFKGIGYVFEEDQPQYHMLVVGSVQVGAELVGGFPELVIQCLQKLLFCAVHHSLMVFKAVVPCCCAGRSIGAGGVQMHQRARSRCTLPNKRAKR